ncbi:MAG: trypsin-like peptidase domain-containing protein [Elusimicrobia bacterium]|nr:trypsin-like peptidase domain-containing protein [Elusimicrobiota bacterium]
MDARPDRILRFAASALLPLVLSASPARAKVDQELVKTLKTAVVNIYTNTPTALAGDTPGSWGGTGFIVDAQKGWIVTNRHVSSRSPAHYKVTFYNGETSDKVNLLYYDAWQDLAVLEVDTTTLHSPLKAVPLSTAESIKEADEVFLIGNNEGENYTVLYGEIINTELNPALSDDPAGDSHRHTSSFEVVYGQRGGSSGSPVFDTRGRVVGVQYCGTDVTGKTLRIDYVKDALDCLRAGRGSCRGEIGVVLDLMKISDAKNYLHIPESEAARLLGIVDRGQKIKDVVYVRKSIPQSPADEKLEPGDVILRVSGKTIGNNLYAFDKEIDRLIGRSASIEIMRNGRPLTVTVPVEDAEKQKVSRFVTFAGGIFHDATNEIRRRFAVYGAGVMLNQVDVGSSLEVGGRYDKYPQWRQILIQRVNGVATPDLETFANEARRFADGDRVYITAKDFVSIDSTPRALLVDLNLKYFPLKQFRYDPQKRSWEAESPAGLH